MATTNVVIDGKAVNATVYQGVPGLPGTSTNKNPLSTSWKSIWDNLPDAGNPGTAGGVATATDPITGAVNAVSGAGSWISDLFLRATIIILGFIFISVGLSMFNKQNIIVSTAKKITGK